MELFERKIDAPEGISCRFYSPTEMETEGVDILVVSFFGEYPEGSSGRSHGTYISRMTLQGLLQFDPGCLILDLRDLRYRRGNSMLRVFHDVSLFKDMGKSIDEPRFPVLVVTSDKSREGFVSLLSSNGSLETHRHFSDIREAISLGRVLAERWRNYPKVA